LTDGVVRSRFFDVVLPWLPLLQQTTSSGIDHGGFQSFLHEKRRYELYEHEFVASVATAHFAARILEIADATNAASPRLSAFDLIDVDAALSFLSASRSDDGVFLFAPEHHALPSVAAVYHGVHAWSILSARRVPSVPGADPKATLAFLESCFVASAGGFQAEPSATLSADLRSTYEAIATLKRFSLWRHFLARNANASATIFDFVWRHQEFETKACGALPDVGYIGDVKDSSVVQQQIDRARQFYSLESVDIESTELCVLLFLELADDAERRNDAFTDFESLKTSRLAQMWRKEWSAADSAPFYFLPTWHRSQWLLPRESNVYVGLTAKWTLTCQLPEGAFARAPLEQVVAINDLRTTVEAIPVESLSHEELRHRVLFANRMAGESGWLLLELFGTLFAMFDFSRAMPPPAPQLGFYVPKTVRSSQISTRLPRHGNTRAALSILSALQQIDLLHEPLVVPAIEVASPQHPELSLRHVVQYSLVVVLLFAALLYWSPRSLAEKLVGDKRKGKQRHKHGLSEGSDSTANGAGDDNAAASTAASTTVAPPVNTFATARELCETRNSPYIVVLHDELLQLMHEEVSGFPFASEELVDFDTIASEPAAPGIERLLLRYNGGKRSKDGKGSKSSKGK
jgi:hypothetical protein